MSSLESVQEKMGMMRNEKIVEDNAEFEFFKGARITTNQWFAENPNESIKIFRYFRDLCRFERGLDTERDKHYREVYLRLRQIVSKKNLMKIEYGDKK